MDHLSLHWTARMSLVSLMLVHRTIFGFCSSVFEDFGGMEVCYWCKRELMLRVRGDRMSFVLGLVQNGKLRGFTHSKDDASIYLINF